MGKLNDVKLFGTKLNQNNVLKVQETQDFYSAQQENIIQFFEKLDIILKKEKKAYLDESNMQLSKTSNNVEICGQMIQQCQRESERFKLDIEQNYSNIIKNIEMEPFMDIMKKYEKKVDDLNDALLEMQKFNVEFCQIKANNAFLNKFKNEINNNIFFDYVKEIKVKEVNNNAYPFENSSSNISQKYENNSNISQNQQSNITQIAMNQKNYSNGSNLKSTNSNSNVQMQQQQQQQPDYSYNSKNYNDKSINNKNLNIAPPNFESKPSQRNKEENPQDLNKYVYLKFLKKNAENRLEKKNDESNDKNFNYINKEKNNNSVYKAILSKTNSCFNNNQINSKNNPVLKSPQNYPKHS